MITYKADQIDQSVHSLRLRSLWKENEAKSGTFRCIPCFDRCEASVRVDGMSAAELCAWTGTSGL